MSSQSPILYLRLGTNITIRFFVFRFSHRKPPGRQRKTEPSGIHSNAGQGLHAQDETDCVMRLVFHSPSQHRKQYTNAQLVHNAAAPWANIIVASATLQLHLATERAHAWTYMGVHTFARSPSPNRWWCQKRVWQPQSCMQ